jgi:hypothetical protein
MVVCVANATISVSSETILVPVYPRTISMNSSHGHQPTSAFTPSAARRGTVNVPATDPKKRTSRSKTIDPSILTLRSSNS